MYQALEGLKEEGYTHIKYTGGEPFKRKDMVGILEKTKTLGLEADISTNASLITEDIARQLGELGLNMVHVSVDGHTKEIHEMARGVNTYKPTIRGLGHLVENGVYVRIGTVICKANEDYLEEMVSSAEELGVDEVIFSYMEPVGRAEEDRAMISTRPMDEVKHELEMLADKYSVKVSYSFTEDTKPCDNGVCPGGTRFLYIDNLGRVSPCTWVVENEPGYRSEMTLKETGIKDILEARQIKEYIAGLSHGCPARMRYG